MPCPPKCTHIGDSIIPLNYSNPQWTRIKQDLSVWERQKVASWKFRTLCFQVFLHSEICESSENWRGICVWKFHTYTQMLGSRNWYVRHKPEEVVTTIPPGGSYSPPWPMKLNPAASGESTNIHHPKFGWNSYSTWGTSGFLKCLRRGSLADVSAEKILTGSPKALELSHPRQLAQS